MRSKSVLINAIIMVVKKSWGDVSHIVFATIAVYESVMVRGAVNCVVEATNFWYIPENACQ